MRAPDHVTFYWVRVAAGLFLAAMTSFFCLPAGAQNPKLAVMPLVGVRVDPEITKILTDVLTVRVSDLDRYDVINADEINAMLGMEKMKDAQGCDSTACAAEVSGALGVDYMLTGNVGRLGNELSIKLTLFDSKAMKVRRRILHQITDDETLYNSGISDAMNEVFGLESVHTRAAGPDSASESPTDGRLSVQTEPAGAVVIVDGESKGTSPYNGFLPPGEYQVSVRMQDYFASSKLVSLAFETETIVRLVLEPLPMNPYKKWGHVSFWTGLGAGGLLIGIGHIGASLTASDYRDGNISAGFANQHLSNVAVSGWVLACAGMVAGVVLWFLSPGDEAWAGKNQAHVTRTPSTAPASKGW